MQIVSWKYVLGFIATFLLLTLLLRITLRFFRGRWRRDTAFREAAAGTSLSAISIGYLLLVLEVCFASFYVQSDFFGFTLASQKWHHFYWKPINMMGLRDVDHSSEDFEGKKPLFVIGDSIVAGYGINDYEDRFSNRLGQMLGEDWRVVTLATSGWNSRHEFMALERFSQQIIPHTIVLTYFINDNIRAIEDAGYTEPRTVVRPEGWKKKIIESSYLLNFVYWRIYRILHANEGEKYWDYIKKVSKDPRVWELHQKELQDFVDFAREHETRLIVLAFPHLLGIEWSSIFTEPVVDFFKSEGIETIDLRPHLEGRDPKTLVVCPLDAHPNEALHEEIAEILFAVLTKQDPGSDKVR